MEEGGEGDPKKPMTSHPRAYSAALAVLFFLLPSATRAATLGFSPASATIDAGTGVTTAVLVSSADQPLNAVSGTITFPPDLLQVISISKASSALSLWVVDPTFSNTDGTISWSGIVPNPGYQGGGGRIFSIQFRGRKAGTATIAFSPSSQVLANDGNGTNILAGTRSAAITITASKPKPVPVTTEPTSDLLAQITSSTHPDQTQWYARSHAVFDWTNAQGISAVRIGCDKNANGTPSFVYSGPISHKEIDLEDGIWYFHVQEKGPNGWGPNSTYRVQIDTVAPLPFAITFPNGTTTSGAAILASFTATDALSGIDHYQVAVDGKEFSVSAEDGSHPYAVSADPGAHMLLVQAYDKAGNVATADDRFSISGGTASKFNLFMFGWLAINYVTVVLIALAVLITLIFAAWYIHTHFTAYRRRLNHQLGLTHTHVHKEFDTLKDAIAEEILALEHAKSKRALTREEERFVARFKKLLDQAEQTIEKDLESVPR